MADLKEMLNQIRERTTPAQKKYVENNMDIVDYIHDLLAERKMKPVDLARLLDKKPAEISKWLSGTHNLTVQSISKLEAALEEDIIMTPARAKSKYETIKYVPLTVSGRVNKQHELFSADFISSEIAGQKSRTFKIHTHNYGSKTRQYSN